MHRSTLETNPDRILIEIAPSYNGPPDIGNGGIVCGLLAEHAGIGCEAEHAGTGFEVELRRPVPIGRAMQLHRTRSGTAGPAELELRDGDAAVAVARPAPFDVAVPTPPTLAQAERASRLAHVDDHPFPHCFVCGPARHEGDGLRVLCGPVEGRSDMVATAWRPHRRFCDTPDSTDARVEPRFVWAALDCPGGLAALAGRRDPILLARFRGRLFARPRVGEPCVLIGWAISRDGRKHVAGTALFGEGGDLLGAAEALWIEPRRERNAA